MARAHALALSTTLILDMRVGVKGAAYDPRDLAADLFRLGSGASDAALYNTDPEMPDSFVDPFNTKEPNNVNWATGVKDVRLKHQQPKLDPKIKHELPTPGKDHKPIPIFMRIAALNPYLVGLTFLALLGHMMAGGNNNGGSNGERFNYRIPPSWSPENDQQYSFRAFMTDISLWIMLTDLQPHQQCAAIIMRLGGSAREVARMITPPEMMQGGMLNGNMVDAVTYLLGQLHAKFFCP